MKPKETFGKSPALPPYLLDFLVSLPVVVLIVVFYFWTALSNGEEPKTDSNYYYPALGRAFAKGQTYLDVKPLPELLALPDPYDPKQNNNLRLHDATLYNGKYYLYFGPTPALLLFAPSYAIFLYDFPQKVGVALFCSLGFVITALLFLMFLRDHFPGVPIWLKLACILTLGMANTCPFLIRRPDVYEIAIGCGYFVLQLVFLFFYCALHQPKRILTWLLLTSFCLGALVGSRPNFVLIVFLFIGFLFWIWRQKVTRNEAKAWLVFTALVPVGVIGLLLAWYNYVRFDNPLEFGTKFALCGVYVKTLHPMQLKYIPYNIWFYFLSPPYLSWQFPFIQPFPLRWFTVPDRYYGPEKVSSLFALAPVTLFALTLPALLNKARWLKDKPLVEILVFMTVTALAMALFILSMNGATMRYFVDFAPTLVFLGCIMVCYFKTAISQRSWMVRWRLLPGLLGLVLFVGCSNGLFLSFTGYYNYLRFGSPETYADVHWLFQPLEVVFRALVDLFGTS